MSWYTTGTIAVTNGSTTITGTGTAFVANVQKGFALLGPDYSVYEIASITSDTVAVLTKAYRGTTASTQVYGIFQTQGIISDLSNQVATLLNTFGPLRAAYPAILAGVQGTAKTFVAGTDFTPGTTTTLALTQTYTNTNQFNIFFDAAFQGPDQFTIAGSPSVATFSSAIPVGVSRVYERGSTPAVGIPSTNSVGVAQLASDALGYFVKVADLASSSGSASIGMMRAGVSGAVASTLAAWAGSRITSVFEFMTNAQRADYASGASVMDLTAPIQAALSSVVRVPTTFNIMNGTRGNTIELPPGTFIASNLSAYPGTKIKGCGSNTTRILNTTTSGNVISFIGGITGALQLAEIEDLAIVQKSGVTHTSGYAINIDGTGTGISVRMRNVYTYGTNGGIYMDWCFPNTLENVHGFVHVNAFLTRFNCTSTTFINCYAGACSGSGFKIAGQYMSLVGCASDSNAITGYEFYYDGGVSVGLSMTSCGTELSGLNGISVDRATGVTIISPRVIVATGGGSAIKITGGAGYTITSPILSAASTNPNYQIDISNSSGAYPNNVTIQGMSTDPSNFSAQVSNADYVFWITDFNSVGLNGPTLRIGGRNYFNSLQQNFQVGGPLPVGVSGNSYAANYRPEITTAFTFAATQSYNPIVAVGAGVLTRLVAGSITYAPTVTSGTISRVEGNRVNEMPAGVVASANIVLGDNAVPVGTWSLCNSSTKINLSGGPIQWGTNTGPQSLFGTGAPAIASSVGSTYKRLDGSSATSFYIKESGTGTTGYVPVATYLTGVTGSIGGSALTAGTATSGTVNITGATTSMTVIATPVTYPGDGVVWQGYVSSAGVVTVKVTAIVGVTPVATTYNIRVIQ